MKISLPLVLPALSAGGLLALIHSIADFGTPRLIGRGFNVLATEAYTLYSAEVGSNLSMATTISIVLILLSMLFVFAQRYMSRRNVYHGNLINKPVKYKLTGVKNAVAHGIVYTHRHCRGDAGFIVAASTRYAERAGRFSSPASALESYRRILYNLSDVVQNSLMFSFATVALIVTIGTLIGCLVARRMSFGNSLLDATLMVPYVMPGIVVGIAFVAAFNTPPFALTGTAL